MYVGVPRQLLDSPRTTLTLPGSAPVKWEAKNAAMMHLPHIDYITGLSYRFLTMKRKHHINGAKEVTEVEEAGVKHVIHKSSGGVKLGDLIWVELHSSSWWPAQVVDADTVSILIKPSERSVGEVLVRVYGSYVYLYVDPLESRTEFEKVLKLYNGKYDQILKESLNKDRLYLSDSEVLAASETTKSVDASPETSFDASPEEDNNVQGKEVDGLSGTKISDYVPEKNSRKLRSRTNNNSKKKNTVVVKKESSLQRRVSPRQLIARNKLDGDLKSEVGIATSYRKSCDETAQLDSENTGKVDNNLNILCKADVLMSVCPNVSARSKRIMQNLGLIAPYGSPFNPKLRHS